LERLKARKEFCADCGGNEHVSQRK